MLKQNEVPFNYREYTKEPLSIAELHSVLNKLGLSPKDVLRRRDPANKPLGLTGEEPESDLLRAMATNPTLLQRPIAVLGDRAVVGRPAEAILETFPELLGKQARGDET